MLEDRDYMRAESDERPWRRRLSVSLWLVIVNAACYAAQLIVPLAGASPESSPRLETYLALYPGDLLHGYIWQLLTFQLLHAGPLHLILNCAMLYMFGRPVEDALGRAGFLKLYFGSGAVGGLFQAVCSWVFPSHFGWTLRFGWPPVVGASAGIFGLIAAFAILNSEASITTFVYFIIPITMRAKYLLVFSALLALFGIIFPDTFLGSNIAHVAHLGGMLAGIFYVRRVIHWHWRWRVGRQPFRRSQPRQLVNVHAKKSARWRRFQPNAEEDLSAEEFLAKEVDPILDKISAHGIHSLTERELQILEAARKKMAKH